jgi:hypothetical protein
MSKQKDATKDLSKDQQQGSKLVPGDPKIVEGEEQNTVLGNTNLSSDQGVANENAQAANSKSDDDSKEADEPETLSEEELARWSKERFLAGQVEAASSVQQRYEKLVRKNNPGREVTFTRNPENGDLMHQLGQTEDEKKKAEDEKQQAVRKEEESRKRIDQAQKAEDEKNQARAAGSSSTNTLGLGKKR